MRGSRVTEVKKSGSCHHAHTYSGKEASKQIRLSVSRGFLTASEFPASQLF